MTLKEQLVKTVLQEFLAYIEAEEKGETMQKELDKSSVSSIHCQDTMKGETSWK